MQRFAMQCARRASMRIGLLAAALAVNACTTLGPDFRQPEVAWLDSWQSDLYGQSTTPAQQQAIDLQFWWRLFDDPVLEQLVGSLRQANPTLRIAGLRVLESRAQLGIADSTRYPQSQQLSAAGAAVDSWQQGGAHTDFVSYQAGFNLAWEFDFWGRFRRAIESADAAFFASIANQQDLQVLLTAQLIDAYFTYRTTQLRIDIARENASLQRRSYEITQRLFRRGQQSELDLQQARAQYLATLSTVPELEILLTRTRNAIAALLGRPPGDLPELTGEHARLPTVQSLQIAAVPAQLLMRRPDIRAASWQLAAQSAQIGIAEADYYPSIALLGNLGWAGNSLAGSRDAVTLSLGPGLQWNLFDHGRVANNIRVQDARLQQLIEQYQDTVLQAAREIDDAAIGVVKTAEEQQVLAQALSAARRALQLANAQYREGYAGFQRVLDAQRALATQSERDAVNRGNHLAAVVALYKALGGGWLDQSIEQLLPAPTREQMRQRSDWGELLDAPLPQRDQPPNASENAAHD